MGLMNGLPGMIGGNAQRDGISDDKFFHLMYHVNPNLKSKIERGEFVDLEKLISKEKFCNSSTGQWIEIVSKGGKTFIMLVDKDNKITNVHRWEQAFRIYAAIYSQANPHWSSEIWQYVFVINSVASTYTWDNVSSYDVTFRQLMACNPMRSWANIYLQMWNLTMRDIIRKVSMICLTPTGRMGREGQVADEDLHIAGPLIVERNANLNQTVDL